MFSVRRSSLVLIVSLSAMLLLTLMPVSAQGVGFSCPSGPDIENGVELLVNVRPGTYRATALGIDGFDPIMGVAFANGDAACEDDSSAANDYAANLPTTGRVDDSNLNAQIEFTNRSSDFADASVVVGGFGGGEGQFLLLIEDLRVTSNDGSGDPFTVHVTPNVTIGYGVYMLGIQGGLDPYVHWMDEDGNTIELDDGFVACDDAGSGSCWGESESLDGAFIRTANATIDGDNLDAMLFLPTDGLFADEDDEGFLMTFGFSSFNLSSEGSYIAGFHFAIGEPVLAEDGGDGGSGVGGVGSGGNGDGGKPGAGGGGGDAGGGKGVLVPVGGGGDAGGGDTIELTCSSTARDVALSGDAGTSYRVICPPGCTDGALWGTGVYTDDSAICTAAIHADVLSDDGGEMLLTIEGAQSGYRGSDSNGIESLDWGQWGRSFSVAPAG
jgi:hypothetical protein